MTDEHNGFGSACCSCLTGKTRKGPDKLDLTPYPYGGINDQINTYPEQNEYSEISEEVKRRSKLHRSPKQKIINQRESNISQTDSIQRHSYESLPEKRPSARVSGIGHPLYLEIPEEGLLGHIEMLGSQEETLPTNDKDFIIVPSESSSPSETARNGDEMYALPGNSNLPSETACNGDMYAVPHKKTQQSQNSQPGEVIYSEPNNPLGSLTEDEVVIVENELYDYGAGGGSNV